MWKSGRAVVKVNERGGKGTLGASRSADVNHNLNITSKSNIAAGNFSFRLEANSVLVLVMFHEHRLLYRLGLFSAIQLPLTV